MIPIVNDRIQFVKEIELPEDNSLEHYVREYFDQMMCMYNITQSFPLSNIIMESDGTIVKFSLVYDNSNDANIIEERLKFNSIINIYKSIFMVSTKRTENTLHVELRMN